MGSMLLTSMNTATTVNANGTIPLGNAVHGYGKDIVLCGNAIRLKTNGYYSITVSIVASSATAATVSANIYSNGVQIANATAGATAAADDTVDLTIPWTIRKNCCAEDNVITVVMNNNVTVTDMIVKVVKL